MTIRFTCVACSSVMKIKDDLAGTSARCPKCKTEFIVPDPTVDPTHQTDEAHEQHSAAHHHEELNHTDAEERPLKSETEPSHEETDAPEPTPEEALSEAKSDQHEADPGAVGESSEDDDVDSNDEEDADSLFASEFEKEESQVPSLVVAGESAAGDSIDELDCPSMFVSLFGAPVFAEPQVVEPRKFNLPRATAEVSADFVGRSPNISRPTSREEPIDPFKFMADREPVRSSPYEPVRPTVPFSPPGPTPSPPKREMESDADLSLPDEPDDSDDEIPTRPTPLPVSRRTPIAPTHKPASEKVDLATAAKMMKKAIKDSQADASRQRELDARPGYDYGLFFREFGLRGLAALIIAVVGPATLYYGFDYMLSSKLKLPKLGYVSGTVKVDGKPTSGVMVYIAPTETSLDAKTKERARTSVGISDDSGHFKMMYAPNIEGVAAGKCRIWLTTTGQNNVMIPGEWMEIAMRTTDVAAGHQKTPFDINIQTKK